MGLKGLRFLGILIATYILVSSEVAARELAETPVTKDAVNDVGLDSPGYNPGSICPWGCCNFSDYGGCICCPYSRQADRHAKLP